MAKIKPYDIEREFKETLPENGAEGLSFSFVSWLQKANSGNLGDFVKKVSQQEVIDRFIKAAPKIKPISKEENFEAPFILDEPQHVNREIVSETLARIYVEQQHYSRAREVYQKLILLFPEKSNYFAALIKECKKLEKKS